MRFILPSHLRLAHSVILGEPLFNEDEFRRFVDSLFTIDAKKYKFLTDLEIPITITATDLRNQRRLDYDRTS